MASSDWTAGVSGLTSDWFSLTGEAQAHSGLTNPLPGRSGNCRMFRLNTGINTQKFLALNRTTNGIVNRTPQHWWRIMAYMRLQLGTATTITNRACLHLRKGDTGTTSGYFLALEYKTTSTHKLTLRQQVAGGGSSVLVVDDILTITATGGDSGWQRLRLDLVPSGTAGDSLRIYRSTDLSTDSWGSPLLDQFIPNGNANYNTDTTTNYAGISVGLSNATTGRAYFAELSCESGGV